MNHLYHDFKELFFQDGYKYIDKILYNYIICNKKQR
ncbi:hypothetical protein ELBR111191_17410 [Elizabethkingia bruuniana]